MRCCLAAGCLFVFAPSALGDPTWTWALGDSWQLAVEMKPRYEAVTYHYAMSAFVLGPEKVRGVDCIKVDFLIPGKPPADLTARHRVFMDPNDGWPRRAFTFRDYRYLSLGGFEAMPMVDCV